MRKTYPSWALQPDHKPARPWQRFLAVAGWLFVWQVASAAIGLEMLLASPVSVAARLYALTRQAAFWSSIVFSLSRIAVGFLLAFLAGALLAAAAYRFRSLAALLQPLMTTLQATPVASYIILLLLLIPSRGVSACIAFLMSLPVMYTNLLYGLRGTGRKLLEMAWVYDMSLPRRLAYLYLPQIMPFLVSACSLSIGLCWKAGIAAEVIAIPRGSIGEKMYQAKVFVDTPALLAWTVALVAVSFLAERAFLYLLRRAASAVERM